MNAKYEILPCVAAIMMVASARALDPATAAYAERGAAAKYRIIPSFRLSPPGARGYAWPMRSMKPTGELKARTAKEIGDSDFVISVSGWHKGGNSWEAMRDYLKYLGIKLVRIGVHWKRVEKEPGVFDWSEADGFVGFCEENGLEAELGVGYGNPIYPDAGEYGLGSKFPSGEGLKRWDDWIDRLSKRYAGRVVNWEGWNEPDIGIGRPPPNSPAEIAALAARTAIGIKKNIPDAKIGAIALARSNPVYIDSVLAAVPPEGMKAFDYFIYHGYVLNPELLYEKVRKIELTLARRAPHVKLWQGENGCNGEYNFVGAGEMSYFGFDDISQAKWDMRRMLGDRARGIRCTLFNLCDFRGLDNVPGASCSKGLLAIDDKKEVVRVKAAYHAVQNLVSVFDSKVKRMAIDPVANRESVDIFAFEKEGLPIIAFWDAGDRKTTPPDGDCRARGGLTLVWTKAKVMKDPVWVDLLSGLVYDFPKALQVQLNDTTAVWSLVPYSDSPCLLCERAALVLNDNVKLPIVRREFDK